MDMKDTAIATLNNITSIAFILQTYIWLQYGGGDCATLHAQLTRFVQLNVHKA